MSGDVPRFIPGVITLVAGTGEFVFNAQGTIDSIWFSPRAPNTTVGYRYQVRSINPDSLRFNNVDIVGERLELIGRIVQQYNKVVILDATVPDAVFDIIIYYAALL